jgi:PmbA protein
MEGLLSRAKMKVQQAEVFSVSSRETTVHFEANQLKQVHSKESVMKVLRIMKDGRIGLAAGNGTGDSAALLDMAIETSQFGIPVDFQFPALGSYPEVDTFDSRVEKIATERMIELGRELVSRVSGHSPRLLCDAEIVKSMHTIGIANSQGCRMSYNKSIFAMGVEGMLVKDTDMLFVGEDESSCRLSAGVDILVERVIRQLDLAARSAAVSTKVLPVVFTPHAIASAFMVPLSSAFNGKLVHEGASALKGKLGNQVFDRKLSLWDDATVEYGVGSRPCDDEGVPSQRISLIDKGVVSHFLYDLHTAALAGTRSTGNGGRGGGGFPKPDPTSLIIGEGDVSLESMVAGMKEGLVVEHLIGGGQGDALSGDFGGNVLLGYKVENGEMIGRVKDTMVAGNVYRDLREIVLGDKARWVGGSLRTPWIYCPRISVSAKGS